MLSIFILLCLRTKVTEQRVVTKGKFKLHHTGKGISYCQYLHVLHVLHTHIFIE